MSVLATQPNVNCDKSSNPLTTETVSHACVEDQTKTEGWNANSTICLDVLGGENAEFGVKDGEGCVVWQVLIHFLV